MPYELGKTSAKFRASIRTNHNHWFNTVVIIAIIIITITIIVFFFFHYSLNAILKFTSGGIVVI